MIIFFVITASLSPLLTFAHLWQLKEWRWDRLREHLRTDGYFRQLFGIVRPLILLGIISVWQLFTNFFNSSISQFLNFPSVTLSILTLLNFIQIITRKQPYPVWTKKATTLVGISLIIDLLASFQLSAFSFQLLPFLVLLQPFLLTLALTLLFPIDHLLKQRILRHAKTLRIRFPNLTVIGITGSAGKTTTKELLAHILGPEAIATPEHVNTELGVAKWLIEILKNVDAKPVQACHGERSRRVDTMKILIVEMGAYREGEIRTLCKIAQPTIGIITSIGTQHIGLFGSQKAIVEAKGELFAALPKNGHAFVNTDAPYTQELRGKCVCPVTTVSTGTPADMQATHIEETPEGLRFQIHTTIFTVPLHGEHQLGNVLLAIAAAAALGMTLEEIAHKLQTFQPPAHTFSLREEHGIHILDDTHNASPESLGAAIEWARHEPHKKKILLTPGIIEQGRAAARTHVRCGALAKEVFDEAYVLNKKFAQYFEEGFGKPVHYSLQTTHYKLPTGSLLVCVGRIPEKTISTLLKT